MRQHTFIKRELINKGWSGDKKYCIFDTQENKFFLRISPYEQYERKKTEYEFMRQAAELHVPMCTPLEFGICEEGVFSIQIWIDGVAAEEYVRNLTSEKQYSYGLKAGKILKEIHKIPKALKIGKSFLIAKRIIKSKYMRSVLSNMKMDRYLLSISIPTDICLAVVPEPISMGITTLEI